MLVQHCLRKELLSFLMGKRSALVEREKGVQNEQMRAPGKQGEQMLGRQPPAQGCLHQGGWLPGPLLILRSQQ